MVITIASAAGAGLEDRKFGAGLIIGDPTGVSFKKWISNTKAVSGAVAWSLKEKFTAQVDFLWHDFKKINTDKGKMPVFYGLGGRIEVVDKENKNNKNIFGIRSVLGIEYIFQTMPVEVFFELGPVLEIVPKIDIGFSGGVGMRYYF